MQSPRKEIEEIVGKLKDWTDSGKLTWRKLPRFAHQCQINTVNITLEQMIGASDILPRLTLGNLSTGPRVTGELYGLGALLDSIFSQYEREKKYEFSNDCVEVSPGVDRDFIKKLDKKNEKGFVDEWDENFQKLHACRQAGKIKKILRRRK